MNVPAEPRPEGLGPAEPWPPSDVELIAASRAGDTTAYATLYERHAAAANGLARQLVRGQAEADDIVAESFAKVLDLLRRGAGPEGAFRPYLLTAVRRAAYDRHRAERRQIVTDQMEAFDPGVPFADPAVANLERTMIARAFTSLPERWQAVLWHTEIEGARPAEVTSLLGLTANGVAALAYRAREGLRQAYLQMHLSDAARGECRPVVAKLGAYVRGGLAKRDAAAVAAHLDQCADCQAVFAELGDVNVALRGIVAPLILGPAAAAYLASAVDGRSAAGWITGRLAWFRHAPKHKQAAAAGVVAAAAAGLTAMAMTLAAHTGPAVSAAAAPRSSYPATAPAPLRPGTQETSRSTARSPSSPASAPPMPANPAPAATSPATAPPAEPVASRTLPSARLPAATQPSAAVPSATRPAVTRPAASAAAPSAVSPIYARLTTRIDPVGTLAQGGTGTISFTATNAGSTVAPQVRADVTLPAGVSYLASGARGPDVVVAVGPGGWTCVAASGGAACTHGPLAPGASATGELSVVIAADAPTGTPPAIWVDDGGARVSARGTAGVTAADTVGVAGGGLPVQFTVSGRYAVIAAGASVSDAAPSDIGGGIGGGVSDTGVVSPPGRVVWAGLYWAWAGGPTRAAIELRGPGGSGQRVTARSVAAVGNLGIAGLADIPVYQGYANVTALIARSGAGLWTASSSTKDTGGTNGSEGDNPWPDGAGSVFAHGHQGVAPDYLGWTLVVVSADRTAPPGRVMILAGPRPRNVGAAALLGKLAAGSAVHVRLVTWTYGGPQAATFTLPQSEGPDGGVAGALPAAAGTVLSRMGEGGDLMGVLAVKDAQQP